MDRLCRLNGLITLVIQTRSYETAHARHHTIIQLESILAELQSMQEVLMYCYSCLMEENICAPLYKWRNFIL